MKYVNILKGNKIYLTKTPAKIVDSKIEPVLRIKMSCGGGIGGSKWYETLKPTTIVPNTLLTIVPNTLIQVETINGETKLINTNFIVEATIKQLITVTEVHQNYNYKETMGKEIDYLYLAPLNVEVEIINDYEFSDKWIVK